jgi:hypothetical protein
LTRLVWDEKPREYAIGVDRGVYYPKNAPGEVWNGLKAVNEDSADTDEMSVYIDGIKTHRKRSNEHFSGTIEAYTYPDGLQNDIFGLQLRTSFGLSYRTMTESGYQIHLVYNVLLRPSGYAHQQNETDTFVWAFTTVPVPVPDVNKTAHLIIDSSIAYSWTIEDLEDALYGSESTDAFLPTPEAIFETFEENAILRIIDNGDGTWTAIGPDSAIVMLDPDTFEITWPSAVYIDADSYTISSL